MVTVADMRYATEDAWFCIQEINIGMTADVGTLQRLPKIIPEGVARELRIHWKENDGSTCYGSRVSERSLLKP